MRHRAVAVGGSSAFDPTTIAGCVGWFRGSDLATITDAGAGAVSQWANKVGNSWNLTEATNRPTTGVNTLNGKNVIKFVGASSQKLASTARQWASASDGALSVFVVFKPASVSGTQSIVDFDSEGSFGTRMDQAVRLDGTTPQAVRIAGGVVIESGPSVASGTAYVASMVHGASAIELWINGTSNGSSAIGSANGTSTAPLGLGHHPGGAGFYTGDVAEIIVYNVALGTTDRQTVEAGLNAEYAVY